MNSTVLPRRYSVALAVYALLDPIPFGFFVAALVFDIIYAHTAVVMWVKGAAWLITIGLLFAIVPRLINLVQVWITRRHLVTRIDRLDFWLNLLAIVAAIFNAFVHSRDAYGPVPTSVWLSACTVLLLCASRLMVAWPRFATGGIDHE